MFWIELFAIQDGCLLGALLCWGMTRAGKIWSDVIYILDGGRGIFGVANVGIALFFERGSKIIMKHTSLY